MKLIKPYTRIRLSFISDELNIDETEVESLLTALVLDEAVRGRIDQVHGVLLLDPQSEDAAKYANLRNWTNRISSLHHNLAAQVS